MSAKILDGKIVRESIREDLKQKIKGLSLKPKLVIIQVGNNPESNTYIDQKIKFGESIGAIVELKKFRADVSQAELESIIKNLNSDQNVHGIIVQMPIPKSLDTEALIELIDPKKDVDGLTQTNQHLLDENSKDAVIPATAKGVISILNFYNIPIKNKKAAVVGRSKLVGKPVAELLRNLGAKVEVGHSQTPDLREVTKPADIIVVAVGKASLIGKGHVSPNQTIIDVGINVIEPLSTKVRPFSFPRSDLEKAVGKPTPRKLVGDVNFAEVSQIVAAITPVPGGVGPMTVASLFQNLLEACKKQNGN